MAHLKKAFWISATLLVLAILVGSVAPPVIAQIRATLVRDIDGPARGTRFVANDTLNFGSGSFFVNETIALGIPAGKKLVVQAVEVHSFLTDSQSVMEARISVGSDVLGYVPQVFQAQSSGSNPQRHFNGSNGLNVVLNPGEDLTVFVFRNSDEGSSGLNFSRVAVRGYLVDANP